MIRYINVGKSVHTTLRWLTRLVCENKLILRFSHTQKPTHFPHIQTIYIVWLSRQSLNRVKDYPFQKLLYVCTQVGIPREGFEPFLYIEFHKNVAAWSLYFRYRICLRFDIIITSSFSMFTPSHKNSERNGNDIYTLYRLNLKIKAG